MSALAAWGFVGITAALAVLQAALIAGAPLGHLAWGGQHRVLPQNLRVSSGIAIVLYALFSAIILMRAGLVPAWPDMAWIIPLAWALVAYLALGTAMNALSRSRAERLVMTPVALILLALAAIVALGA